MLKIQRMISAYKRTPMKSKKNTYIVVHGTGTNASAKANATYYGRKDARDASATVFIDPTSIIQVVEDFNAAWHCGGGLQGFLKGAAAFFKKCLNSNSIGVEMCFSLDKNGQYFFDPRTLQNAAEYIARKMVQYHIPLSHVIRHWEVTGKPCPAPTVKPMYGLNNKAWADFKAQIQAEYNKLIKPPAKPSPVKPPASTVQIPKPTLKKGSKGVEVKKLQKLLRVAVDGSFGPKTETALKSWQKGHKLTADGSYGPATAKKFKEAFK